MQSRTISNEPLLTFCMKTGGGHTNPTRCIKLTSTQFGTNGVFHTSVPISPISTTLNYKIGNYAMDYFRSEERRVGKECRVRRQPYHGKKKRQHTHRRTATHANHTTP